MDRARSEPQLSHSAHVDAANAMRVYAARTGARVVISADLLRHAGMPVDTPACREIAVAGRTAPLSVAPLAVLPALERTAA